MLGQLCSNGADTDSPLIEFAAGLAVNGALNLRDVPHLQLGQLLTLDRHEMEAIRGLKRLLLSYKEHPNPRRPLCIGVFGPPGSGKSFAVQELSRAIFAPTKSTYDGWMEFNLSQFEGPKDLTGAFHQVRDRALQGLTPIVFWDEFDSNHFSWLRFFLAAMQDGRFQEEQLTHTLGRCIFVFAGGVSKRFADFGAAENEEGVRRFIEAKGPDFKSRLDDHLDILGPNPINDEDVLYPVRRAVLVRAFLGAKSDEVIDIERGLLYGFLRVKHYTHGARSMERLLEPLKWEWRRKGHTIHRWILPPPNQMSLHVDQDNFFEECDYVPANVDQDDYGADVQLVEALVEEIKRDWADRLQQKDDLTIEACEALAHQLPGILETAGLRITKDAGQSVLGHHIGASLAARKHDIAEKIHETWQTLNASRTSLPAAIDSVYEGLKPFRELNHEQQEEVFRIVEQIPTWVRAAGYKLVWAMRAGYRLR